MSTTSKEDICKILNIIKKSLGEKKVDFVPRNKNLQSLASKGLTIQDVWDCIMELEIEDYYKGPEADYDSRHSDFFWIFKKQIDMCPFYIKFKVIESQNNLLKIISFHIDESF